MSLLTAYTPLEELLLFQALRADGVHSISFNRISDQLKSIPLLRSDPSYDSGRLSPDALRELYLGLLKDEVKRDLERQQNGHTTFINGDSSPGSRKRKIASPSLPTVHEAAQHTHLIPQLVERLYASYRDKTVVKIKNYESKYAEAKREIAEIEAGQWDESLQRAKPSPKPSSTAHTQPILARNDHAQPVSATVSPVGAKQPSENGVQAPPKPFSQAKIDAVINHGPEPQDSSGGHQRVSSNTILPPLSEMAPQSPQFGIPPKIPASSPHQPLQMQPMPPQAPNHAYTQTPPMGHQSPYASHHAHPRQGSMSSPQLQQSLSRPSSSPRPILPPPPGMSLPPPSPIPHSGSPGQVHYPPPQPHYQPPPQHRNVQPAPTHQPAYPGTPMHQHPPAGYYQQQLYQDRRTSYQPQLPQTPTYPSHPPPHQQPYMQPHPGQAQQGAYMQPFQLAPQDPNRPLAPPQHRPAQQSTMPVLVATPYASHVHRTPATGPRQPPQQARMVSDIIAALATPPRQRVRPLWKERYRPSPVVTGSEMPRPLAEPLSPTLERAKSPARSTRSTRGREAHIAEEPLNAEPASKTRSNRRKTSKRDRSPHSVVSSTADDSKYARSTRSQSVSTAAGAYPPSDDRPGSRNGVKVEPSTPADVLEEAEPMPAPSASSTSGIVTRKRRGTLQSQPPPPNNKRKRQESPVLLTAAAPDGEPVSTPPPRSTTVLATRNFAKMSSAVMNDILSHKHAAYFNAPVRDKDAPGYSDIVRQPQNLKAIRSAITAGTHAVKAASVALEDPSDTPSSTTGTLELELTPDIVPPKAIVNGAQLEKELYRTFANAYMFNPGEDGMALSTKEMFEDVEAKMSDWRGTERLAGVEEEDDGKGKRRKV